MIRQLGIVAASPSARPIVSCWELLTRAIEGGWRTRPPHLILRGTSELSLRQRQEISRRGIKRATCARKDGVRPCGIAREGDRESSGIDTLWQAFLVKGEGFAFSAAAISWLRLIWTRGSETTRIPKAGNGFRSQSVTTFFLPCQGRSACCNWPVWSTGFYVGKSSNSPLLA